MQRLVSDCSEWHPCLYCSGYRGQITVCRLGQCHENIMTPEKLQPIITFTWQGLLIAVQTACYLSDTKVESALTSRFSWPYKWLLVPEPNHYRGGSSEHIWSHMSHDVIWIFLVRIIWILKSSDKRCLCEILEGNDKWPILAISLEELLGDVLHLGSRPSGLSKCF